MDQRVRPLHIVVYCYDYLTRMLFAIDCDIVSRKCCRVNQAFYVPI